MMHKILFLIAFFITLSSYKKAHDVHVTVTDINIDQNGIMKLTSKIFYDDLQLAMGLKPGEELPKKYKGGDDLIAKFLSKHIKIKSGKSPIIFTYNSSKAAMPAIWANTEAKLDIKNLPTELIIENTMFVNTYSDQVNMLNITINGKTTHLALNVKKTTTVVKLR